MKGTESGKEQHHQTEDIKKPLHHWPTEEVEFEIPVASIGNGDRYIPSRTGIAGNAKGKEAIEIIKDGRVLKVGQEIICNIGQRFATSDSAGGVKHARSGHVVRRCGSGRSG